jgi:hypothetical protein
MSRNTPIDPRDDSFLRAALPSSTRTQGLSRRSAQSPAAVVWAPKSGAAAAIAGTSATIAIPRAIPVSRARAIPVAGTGTGTSATVSPAIRWGLIRHCGPQRFAPLLHNFMMLGSIRLTLARRQTPHRRSVLRTLFWTHQLTAIGLGQRCAYPNERQRSGTDKKRTPVNLRHRHHPAVVVNPHPGSKHSKPNQLVGRAGRTRSLLSARTTRYSYTAPVSRHPARAWTRCGISGSGAARAGTREPDEERRLARGEEAPAEGAGLLLRMRFWNCGGKGQQPTLRGCLRTNVLILRNKK